jgi:hypothetical protein
MRKTFLALILGLLIFSTYANAEGMRPLSEVVASENSLPIKKYVFQRCSALSIGIASLILTRPDREESKALSDQYHTSAGLFSLLAIQASEKIGQSISLEQNRNTIERIRDLYHDRWDANYAASGNLTDNMTQEDLKNCMEMLK